MAQFPISKRDKREIIEDFLVHVTNMGVVFAEEVEDDKTKKVTLDRYTGVKDLVTGFLASAPKEPVDDEQE